MACLQQARLLPAGCSSSRRSRCSRSSKEISSRARPARQKSRATSLMVLPPILLWTEGSHSLHHATTGKSLRGASSTPYRQASAILSMMGFSVCRINI